MRRPVAHVAPSDVRRRALFVSTSHDAGRGPLRLDCAAARTRAAAIKMGRSKGVADVFRHVLPRTVRRDSTTAAWLPSGKSRKNRGLPLLGVYVGFPARGYGLSRFVGPRFFPSPLSPQHPSLDSPRPYSGEGGHHVGHHVLMVVVGVRAFALCLIPSPFLFVCLVYFVVSVLRGHFSERRGSQYLVWTEKRRSPNKSMLFSWSKTCRSVFALSRKLFFRNRRFRPSNAMLSTPPYD